MTTASKKQPLIITGLSGAGLSSVLKNLEDLGFEAFDNFPLSLVEPLIQDSAETNNLAIGIDSRTRGFSAESVLKTVKDINARLIYITCDPSTLQKRFNETRRTHPLAKDKPVREGIDQEQELLGPLKAHADLCLDTTHLSVHDLRHMLEGHFEAQTDKALSINLISFGFRRGLPREADIVMDVRFLQNPYWIDDLKNQNGLDQAVGEYIQQDAEFERFLKHFQNMIKPLIPRYRHEGKHYLTIAIGCTGGQHRSVYVAEKIKAWLASIDHHAHIVHRDLKSKD